MLSRQESSLSSSRRQAAATPPPETHQAKAIGCMSGIIHLFSKYQNRNKRITFGRKKQEKYCCKPSSPPKSKGRSLLLPPTKLEDKTHDQKRMSDSTKRLSISCDDINVTRSPTIPAEIRRQSNGVNSSESPRTPSASLVARLMGLEDNNYMSSTTVVKRPPIIVKELEHDEPIIIMADKRRRLLNALDKCNDDLETLRSIIHAVKSPQTRPHTPPPQVVTPKSGINSDTMRTKERRRTEAEQELSPVCVLDEFTRSPPNPTRFTKLHINTSGSLRVPLHPRKPAPSRKPGEDDEPIAKQLLFSKSSTTTEYASLIQMKRQAAAARSLSSRAMVKSVEEVCSDIIWGEKREIRRIGLVLQDRLCKDLVEELVQELMKSCCINIMAYSLPLQGCKRKLCF